MLAKGSAQLAEQEDALTAWQEDWLMFTESASGAQQTIVAMASQLADLESQKSSVQEQVKQAEQALPGCDSSKLHDEIDTLKQRQRVVDEALSQLLSDAEKDQQRRQDLLPQPGVCRRRNLHVWADELPPGAADCRGLESLRRQRARP